MCTFSNITQCTIKILPLYSHFPTSHFPFSTRDINLFRQLFLCDRPSNIDLLNYCVFHTKCNLQTLKFISTNLKD